jgi:hypothetical protein
MQSSTLPAAACAIAELEKLAVAPQAAASEAVQTKGWKEKLESESVRTNLSSGWPFHLYGRKG